MSDKGRGQLSPLKSGIQGEVVDLRVRVGEVADLLTRWREGYSELHVALLELSLLVRDRSPAQSGGGRGGGKQRSSRQAPRRPGPPEGADERGTEAAEQDSDDRPWLEPAAWSAPGAGSSRRGQQGGRGAGGRGNGTQSNGCAEPDGSGDSDSSNDSFDLEVDEEWSRRLQEIEVGLKGSGDDEEDDPYAAIRLPYLDSRYGPQGLERIDEGSNEDDTTTGRRSSCCSSAASRDSSVERMWAEVRTVGLDVAGPSSSASAATAPSGVGHKEDEPLSRLAGRAIRGTG